MKLIQFISLAVVAVTAVLASENNARELTDEDLMLEARDVFTGFDALEERDHLDTEESLFARDISHIEARELLIEMLAPLERRAKTAPSKCPKCGANLKGMAMLDRAKHVENCGKSRSSSPDPLTCPICGKKSKNAQGASTHRNTHYG